jgi:hypothetical protein
MVKALLPDTPQKAFADRISLWSMKRRFENLNRTCCSHASKTWTKFTIIITNQILWRLPIRCSLSERYARPKNRSGFVSRLRGSLSVK